MMFWKSWITRTVFLVLTLHAAPGAATTPAADGRDFTLEGPHGPVSLSDLEGKAVLIFFGYTSCADVCPISLARIDACFSAMGEEELEHVQALFITLDPERDTAETLEKYTNYFHPKIIGLRGDVAEIDAVTAQYGVTYSREPMPGSSLGYSISHPADILLLDQRGEVVETVPHDAKARYLLARIRAVLNGSD